MNSLTAKTFSTHPESSFEMESINILPNPCHHCDIHTQKNLNLICCYSHCSKKGLICPLCQHADHFDHSEYCLPWEIFLENIEKYRCQHKDVLEKMKKRLKAINNRTKLNLINFAKKTNEICNYLSNEVSKNADSEVNLMNEVWGRERKMCHNFKDYEGDLSSYKSKIKKHLETIKVEVHPKKAEKITFSSVESEERIKELIEMEKMTEEFEAYLKRNLGEEEERIGQMYGMAGFRNRFEDYAKDFNATGSGMKAAASTKESFLGSGLKAERYVFNLFFSD